MGYHDLGINCALIAVVLISIYYISQENGWASFTDIQLYDDENQLYSLEKCLKNVDHQLKKSSYYIDNLKQRKRKILKSISTVKDNIKKDKKHPHRHRSIDEYPTEDSDYITELRTPDIIPEPQPYPGDQQKDYYNYVKYIVQDQGKKVYNPEHPTEYNKYGWALPRATFEPRRNRSMPNEYNWNRPSRDQVSDCGYVDEYKQYNEFKYGFTGQKNLYDEYSHTLENDSDRLTKERLPQYEQSAY